MKTIIATHKTLDGTWSRIARLRGTPQEYQSIMLTHDKDGNEIPPGRMRPYATGQPKYVGQHWQTIRLMK